MFVVTSESVRSGIIRPQDIIQFAFTFPRPAGLWFSKIDSGMLYVDPITGRILSGWLSSTYSDQTGNYYCLFQSKLARTDNEHGFESHGQWLISVVP
jgi:hypothetical protein